MVVLLASTALPLATMAPPPPMVAMREEAEAATLDLRLGGLRGARWLRPCMWGPPVGAKESGRCLVAGGAKESVDDCCLYVLVVEIMD